MKYSNDLRTLQRLYKLLLVNLKAIVLIFIISSIIWLVFFSNPITRSNDIYRPKTRELAVKLVASNIEPIQSFKDPNVSDSSLSKNYFGLSENCINLESSNNISKYIKDLNESLNLLYEEQYLMTQYALNTSKLEKELCTSSIDNQSLKYAVKLLSKPNRLRQLSWSEKGKKTNFEAEMTGYAVVPKSWLVQTNPWYGLSGCVYIKDSYKQTYSYISQVDNDLVQELCNNPQLLPPAHNNTFLDESDKPILSAHNQNYKLPPNLNIMYSELQDLHSRHFDKELIEAYENYHKKNDDRNALSKLFASPINSINVEGADIKIGYNLELTLEPNLQNFAQNLAECMTHDIDKPPNELCDSLMSSHLKSDAREMYENALVRSIGIAIIDVPTQSIVSLASSHSDCFAYDNGVNIKNKNCPVLWKRDWSGEKLLNHALYQSAAPGSIIKPIQALGLIRSDEQLQQQNSAKYKYLKKVMASSSTQRVANFLLCYKTTSSYTLNRDSKGVCPGLTAFQQASKDMGWNVNCREPSPYCGFKDLLFGLPYNADPMIQSKYFSGRLLTDSQKNYEDLNFSASNVRKCVASNGGQMSGSCKKGGDGLNKAMNEIYGAGNAKTSVLGAAEMLSTLLIAENGDNQRRGAHLIDEIWGVDQVLLRPKAWRQDATYGATENLAMIPNPISQKDAKLTLDLFHGTLQANSGLGGRNGTAYRSCQEAIGDCTQIQNKSISKTGTPGFKFPKSSNRYTPKVNIKMVSQHCQSDKPNNALCNRRPYKWFILGLKNKENTNWDKAIAILVERNWTKSGMVDDPNDSVNRSAQAGSIIAKHLLIGTE